MQNIIRAFMTDKYLTHNLVFIILYSLIFIHLNNKYGIYIIYYLHLLYSYFIDFRSIFIFSLLRCVFIKLNIEWEIILIIVKVQLRQN